MASIPAHVLQVRDALVRTPVRADAPPMRHQARSAAIAWLQGDLPQPVDGWVFRLETERTPQTVHHKPVWRFVLRAARGGLGAHDFEWFELINVEA